MVRKMTRTVILSRVDGEGSPNAKTSHFAILRRASPTQDDGRVIRSRVDGEGSPNAKTSHFAILRRAAPPQDDGRDVQTRPFRMAYEMMSAFDPNPVFCRMRAR